MSIIYDGAYIISGVVKGFYIIDNDKRDYISLEDFEKKYKYLYNKKREMYKLDNCIIYTNYYNTQYIKVKMI